MKRIPWGVVVLLLLAAVLRIYHASDFHHRHELQYGKDQIADHGISALMAKHMAEGADYPVFYYGQCYMGSFEPAVSAVFCRWFGPSLFSVCLGTIFLGLMALLGVYFWARQAGGASVGLLALAFCVAGPPLLFWYSVAPRGGYMATLFFSLAAVGMSVRITARCMSRQPVAAGNYLFMGLAAGLGWWTNQLAVGAIMTAGMVLLAGWRGRVQIKPALIAALGFFAGSAPWWWWNVAHQWRTFGFAEEFALKNVHEGLHFLRLQAPTFINGPDDGLVLSTLRWFTLVVVAALSLVEAWRRRRSVRGLAILSAWLLLIIPTVLFLFSQRAHAWASVRYHILGMPAMALIMAVGLRVLARKAGAWVMVFGLIWFASGQMDGVRRMVLERGIDRVGWAQVDALVRFCRRAGIDVIYDDYSRHWLNFATREKICVVTDDNDRYAPYPQKAEVARNAAYLRGYHGIEAFLKATASTWSTTNFVLMGETNLMTVNYLYDIRHPAWDPYPVPCADISVDGDLAAGRAMVDGDVNTAWKAVLKPGRTHGISILFPGPVKICGLRFLSVSRFNPRIRSIRAVGADGGACVLTDYHPLGFFWSGPRIYRGDIQQAEEILFAPRELTRLDLELESEVQLIELNEVECLAPAPGGWPRDWHEEEIYRAVVQQHGRRLYAPRWIGAYCYERSWRRLVIPFSAAYRRGSIHQYWNDSLSGMVPVSLTPETILVVRRPEAEKSLAVLREQGIVPHVRPVGPFVMLWFDAENWKEPYRYCGNLYWVEGGVRYGDEDHQVEKRAQFFLKQAKSPGCRLEDKIKWLTRCVETYPDYQPAWLELATLCRWTEKDQLAVAALRQWQKRTEPPVRCGASFPQDVKLLGYEMSARRVVLGRQGKITFYWRVPPDVKPAAWSVFLHLRQGRRQIQGDQVFLENYPEYLVRDQAFEQIFRQEMQFEVPADAAAGEYKVYVGLCDRTTRKRLNVKSPNAAPRQCVRLPDVVSVVAP